MASDRARERTVHKYYQSWLESSVGYRALSENDRLQNTHRFHLDGTSLRASNDKTLIAFAQLGCLRLNAKRGIVTLLSTNRQYVLAEATKTISLNHLHNNHDQGDELWFGNASLPRHQGISGDALTPDLYTAVGPDGAQHSAPALVVNDIALDSRYSRRGYAGNGVNFYCGVPIVAASGYPIGVYTVTDDKPRDGLLPQELRFLQDMATVVMDHLETVKNDSARFRGERLVLGLGHFIQGESTIYQDRSFNDSPPADSESSQRLLPTEDVDESVIRFKGMTITDADPNFLMDPDRSRRGKIRAPSDEDQTMTTLTSPVQQDMKLEEIFGSQSKQNHDDEAQKSPARLVLDGHGPDVINSSQSREVEQVFARAANILLECAAADGVVFYDAVSKNFAKGPGASNYTSRQDRSQEAPVGSESSDDNTSTDRSSDFSDRSTSASSGPSDGDQPQRVLSSRGRRCRMLAYSLDISTESTATVNTIRSIGLSEQSLRRFIRRFPQGKMFYFSENGEVSSDSDESTSPRRVKTRQFNVNESSEEPKPQRSRISIAEELIHVVPGARSVIWLPLWDFAKQRWSAGTFLWSRHPDRLLSAQEDITYLRTFGSCIMGEIARLEALSTDTARTTFIANISHELRSPLHGILGSIEFIQDTPLDAFQSSMVTAVETCGKTLLDTVDHVLDYAKINNLSKDSLKKGSGKKSRSESRQKDDSSLNSDFNLAVVIEEVIEAVYAGQSFRTAKTDDTLAPRGHHNTQSPEETRIQVQRGSPNFSGAVRIVLVIDKQDSWWVHGQPGAIRRIVMNVFGNALKYTNKGTIRVSLKSDVETVKSGRACCISVTDTGIGMSPEFLHNHAFTAFTQESRFSVGAGLGLNIVRQIVNSLGGKIEVFSKKGVGTEVKIWLNLPEVPDPMALDSDDLMARVAQKTAGQQLCLLNPKAGDNEQPEQGSDPGRMVQSALQELVRDWFGMHPRVMQSMEGLSADYFIYVQPPPLEYLLEHHGIHARRTEVPVIILATNALESSSLLANGINQLTDIGRVVEVMTQPCGPQKLANILHRAMLRLAQLTKNPQSRHATDTADAGVFDSFRTSEKCLEGSQSNIGIDPRLHRIHVDQLQPVESHGAIADSAASEVKKYSYDASPSTPKRPNPREAEDIRLNVDQDEPGLTLSPQTGRPARPTLPRRSTMDSSSTGFDDYSVPATPTADAPRILLVDDNEINLSLLVAFMKKARLPYEAAEDGLQALDAYKRAAMGKRFAHVLMDISMPVMDGITSTREIRQFEKKEGLPPANIIALTGQASEATREELFKAGGDQFLTKPVKFKELMRNLERLK